MGHFVLQDNNTPKVFIGTGTGFAPLYFQILAQKTKKHLPMRFIFGVREEVDIFYVDILDRLTKDMEDFSYQLCLSKVENIKEDIYDGYVTQKLKEEFAEHKESEFYIC